MTNSESESSVDGQSTYRKNGLKWAPVRECPYPDCDWSHDRPVSATVNVELAEMEAEEHWDREHAGKIELTAVFTKTVSSIPHNDAQKLSDRLNDKLLDERPAGMELAITYGKVVEEADELPEGVDR